MATIGIIQSVLVQSAIQQPTFKNKYCYFGCDINEATPVAFNAVNDFIKAYPSAFDEIRFVVFSDADLAVYKKYENLLLIK